MAKPTKKAELACSNVYVKMRPRDRKSPESFYEMTYSLRHDASSQDARNICGKIAGTISNLGGSIKKIEYWGLRGLKYRIKRNKKVHFYSMQFVGNQEINLELDRNLKISDNVIRHIILRIRNIDLTPSTMVVSEPTTKSEGESDIVFDNRYIIQLDSI